MHPKDYVYSLDRVSEQDYNCSSKSAWKKGGKVKNTNSGGNGKAEKLSMSQLIVLSAYRKIYSTGKKGFHGKVLDPATGKRYQVVTAVEIQ